MTVFETMDDVGRWLADRNATMRATCTRRRWTVSLLWGARPEVRADAMPVGEGNDFLSAFTAAVLDAEKKGWV